MAFKLSDRFDSLKARRSTQGINKVHSSARDDPPSASSESIEETNETKKGSKIGNFVKTKIRAFIFSLIPLLVASILPIIVIVAVINFVGTPIKYIKDLFADYGDEGYSTFEGIVRNALEEYGRDTATHDYVDEDLIINTLTLGQDQDAFTNKNIEENSDRIRLAARILARYQLINNNVCAYPSDNMRMIASNDKSYSKDFWENELENEANYNCNPRYELSPQSGSFDIRISNAQGDVNNDDSGSVFFWNLYDGDFLENYFPYSFDDATTDNEKQDIKLEIIENIYAATDMAKILKDENGDDDISTPYYSGYETPKEAREIKEKHKKEVKAERKNNKDSDIELDPDDLEDIDLE